MIKYIAIYLFLLLPTLVFTQEIHKLTSGQQLLETKDGSWESIANGATLDEEGNLVYNKPSEESVFELPESNKKKNLTYEQIEQIERLTKQLSLEERDLYIEQSILNRKIKGYEALKSSDLLLRETKAFKKQRKYVKYRYKNVGKMLLVLQDIENEKPKSVQNILDNIQFRTVNKTELEATENEVETTNVLETNYDVQFPSKSDRKKPKMFPADFDCKIAFNGRDKTTEQRIKEIEPSVLFTYTHEKLKPHFKSDNFLVCESKLSRVDKEYFLTLDIRIKSKRVKKSYGKLKKGGQVQIEFLDGSKIFGINTQTDKGIIEPYSGNTLYRGTYRLKREDLRLLKRNLVDNIGVVWTSGYEKYDVFNVDLLSNQVKCLQKR